MMHDFSKTIADGFCNQCDKPVPIYNINKLYCSYYCCQMGYYYFHDKLMETDCGFFRNGHCQHSERDSKDGK